MDKLTLVERFRCANIHQNYDTGLYYVEFESHWTEHLSFKEAFQFLGEVRDYINSFDTY